MSCLTHQQSLEYVLNGSCNAERNEVNKVLETNSSASALLKRRSNLHKSGANHLLPQLELNALETVAVDSWS